MAGAPDGAYEDNVSYNLAFRGPLHLPFGHNDVRVYIDTLFIDGLLQGVTHAQSAQLTGTWVAVGVRTDPQADRRRRLKGLLQAVEETLPSADARHPEWLLFAFRWAELTALWLDLYPDVPEATAEQLQHVRQQLDAVFLAWVQSRYAGLHNQPALPPVMLHHVPRALARHREGNGSSKIAVVDGLALDQWIVLRDILHTQWPALIYREHAVFAWLPTITSVSRQALFAGKPPLYFPSSIHTTDREPALWTQFWTDQGLTANWPAIGLPGDFLPLMAPGRHAFISPGDRIVAHGGITLEELVVPVIHVEQRTL